MTQTSTNTEFRLVEEGLPLLLPPMVRGPGIHMSEAISSLCIRLGHYDEQLELPVTRVQLGQAFEHWIIDNLCRKHPDRYVKIGEVYLDGVPGNLDIFDTWLQCVVEIKLTWMSAKNDPTTTKMWKFVTQLKSYCKAMGVKLGKLMVGFMCDRTGDGDVPFKVWQGEFSQQSLDENWTIVRNEVRRMEARQ